MEPTATEYREGPGLIASVLAHKGLVVAVTLVGTVLAYLLGGMEPVRFEATARLILSDLDDSVLSPQQRTDPLDEVRGEAQKLGGREIRLLTAESLDLQPFVVRDRVSVGSSPETRTLIITASGPTRETAAELANTLANTYQIVSRREEAERGLTAIQQLNIAIDAIQAQIDDLQGDISPVNPGQSVQQIEVQQLVQQRVQFSSQVVAIQTYLALYDDGVEGFELADPPGERSAPNPLNAAIIGLVLSALVAVALAYWRAGRFDRIADADDAASVLGVPLLGEIPDLHGAQDARVAEAFLFVLSSVEFALQRIRGKSVLITSPAASSNKTESALHLSAAGARDGRETILVDGDVRHRSLSMAIEIDKLNGLTELAAGERSVDECIYNYWVAPDLSLAVVGAGRGATDTQSFVRTTGFRRAMLELKEEAELIVVDAAPILSVADTSVIAGQVDGLVLIVEKGMPVQQLIDTRERLAFVTAPLLGYLYIGDEGGAGRGIQIPKVGQRRAEDPSGAAR